MLQHFSRVVAPGQRLFEYSTIEKRHQRTLPLGENMVKIGCSRRGEITYHLTYEASNNSLLYVCKHTCVYSST